MSENVISQEARSPAAPHGSATHGPGAGGSGAGGSGTSGSALDHALEHIRQALSGLKFGHVAIIVQDGVVVQVERTERRRLRRSEH